MPTSSMTVTGMPNTKRMRTVFQRAVFGLAQEATVINKPFVVEQLKAPARVAYPIEWQSEKQRKAFWATDGFGGGIPHIRTGAIEDANRLYAIQNPDGATVILENLNPKAKYVYGGASAASARLQQRMHRNSGWPLFYRVKTVIYQRTMQTFRDNFAQTLIAFGYFETSGKQTY